MLQDASTLIEPILTCGLVLDIIKVSNKIAMLWFKLVYWQLGKMSLHRGIIHLFTRPDNQQPIRQRHNLCMSTSHIYLLFSTLIMDCPLFDRNKLESYGVVTLTEH